MQTVSSRARASPNVSAGGWALAGALTAGLVVGTIHLSREPDDAAVPIAAQTEPTRVIETPSERATATPAPPPPAAPIEVAVSPKPHAHRAARVDAPPPEVDAPPPEADAADTALEAAVEILRRAERSVATGDAVAALSAIDGYRRRFDRGPLWRDMLTLERRAACASADATRAEGATRELATLGLAGDREPACP